MRYLFKLMTVIVPDINTATESSPLKVLAIFFTKILIYSYILKSHVHSTDIYLSKLRRLNFRGSFLKISIRSYHWFQAVWR